MVSVYYSGKHNIGGGGTGYVAGHEVSALFDKGYLGRLCAEEVSLKGLDDVQTIRIRLPQQPAGILNDILFDGISALHIPDASKFSHYYGWSGTSLYTMLSAGDELIKIINLYSAHIDDQAYILNNEVKALFGKDAPPMVYPENILKIRREFELADVIHVPSEFIYKTLEARGLGHKVVINPFGVDLEKYKPIEAYKDDKFRVMYAGPNWIRKGLIYLLTAWNKLDLPDAELIVAGVREPVAESKNTKWGWFDDTEMPKLYNSASLFVLPALEDGCPLAVYEAMACGVPVVITTNTGSYQMIENGRNGFVVQPKDVNALMEIIKRIYNEPDFGEYLGKMARKTAERYTWDAFKKRYIEMIEKAEKQKN